MTQCGEGPQKLFWAPGDPDFALVNKLLDAKWRTNFAMAVKTIDDTAMLTPTGVVFTCPPKPVADDVGKVMVLGGENDVDAEVEAGFEF